MAYPDNWTAGESDTQRYKMCGNGIVSNVVQAVMERLFQDTKSIKESDKE
jgi:site-specific DNA-cytosine methylase